MAKARINGEEIDLVIDERPAFNPLEGRGGDHHWDYYLHANFDIIENKEICL